MDIQVACMKTTVSFFLLHNTTFENTIQASFWSFFGLTNITNPELTIVALFVFLEGHHTV